MAKLKVRKIHKWVGLFASLYVFMAVISGIIHIIMANFFTPPPQVMSQGVVNIDKINIPITEIIKKLPNNFGEVKSINFRNINGELYYQFIFQKPIKPEYVNATSGKYKKNLDKKYAKQIAEEYLKQSNLRQIEYLTNFNNEYLNIFRILPVYKFEAENNMQEKIFVSTNTGSVTLYLNKYRALSQFSFSYLHKFQFIENKIIRDVLLGLSALSILFVSGLGIYIFIRK